MAKRVLPFLRRLVSDHNVQLPLVVPVQPFQGFPIEVSSRFQRIEVIDDLRLDQSDDGFGQGVVLAVAEANGQHVNSSLAEPFRVSYARMPHARPSGELDCRTPDSVRR